MCVGLSENPVVQGVVQTDTTVLINVYISDRQGIQMVSLGDAISCFPVLSSTVQRGPVGTKIQSKNIELRTLSLSDGILRIHCKPASNAAVACGVLKDGGGLFLEVTPAGKKFWRFRYTRPNTSQLPPAKRRNRLSLGI